MNLMRKLMPVAVLIVVGLASAPAVAAAPPETTISGGPTNGSVITETAATFTFESTGTDATFSCRLGDAFGSTPPPFEDCGPDSFTTDSLADGHYRFEVYATSQADGADPTPAARTFTVDAEGGPDFTPPTTTITVGPAEGSTISDSTPTFGFEAAADASDVGFLCSIDDGALDECTSPYTTGALTDGHHTFSVRGLDDSGNLEEPAQTRTFTVQSAPTDTAPPRTSIDKHPKKRSAKRMAKLAFSATEPASFECKLTGKKRLRQFAPCASPLKYRNLKKGRRYSFKVRATDLAGNVGNAARFSWKVKRHHR